MKTLFINMLLLFTATLSFAQVPNYVPTNGLVGWWPFNGNANDESGNGNNGTVNGATLTTDRNGQANKAYSFDGVDDFISTNFINLEKLTISAWIKTNSNQVNGDIVNKYGCTTFDGYSLRLANGKPSGYKGCNQTDFVDFDQSSITYPSANNNVWNNLILTVDTNITKVYLNGLVIDSLYHISCLTSNNYQLYFGYYPIGNCIVGMPNNYTNGIIDDIGIWNRALSQCEITDLYNAQSGSSVTTSTLTQSSCNSYTLNNQTYTQSGTYTQNLTNVGGCDSIITLNLTINNSPTASGSSTGATFHGATDGTVNLTVSGGASPYSFSWSNGANTEDLNAVAAGSYTVTITDANNCSTTTSITVNQPPLALVKSPESIISSALYPNPATAQTRLDLQLNQAQDFEIAVYNNLGQRIFNKNFSNTKELSENIDMRSWPAGQYFVEIKLPNGTETKKLIKE